MRIACLQFAPQVGDVNNNLNRADAVLSRANPDDLDLLVLPELAFSGYNFKSLGDISPFLEPTGAGITSLWARTTALKYNCVVAAGYPEKVDVSRNWPTSPEYYNSVIIVNQEGETTANYRKSHLYYTDETWALEGSGGFHRGYIPGVGRMAMGICMDLNPYKFEAPWSAFEFAFHILDVAANIVVLSMAWLTREDSRHFSRTPKEPDMETLTYWVKRLEPLIRAESDDEIIVIFANRTGVEDDAVYAGTSAVIGIQHGEVSVYGLLGRGEKELLVVDTSLPPFAKLVYRPEGETLLPDGTPAEYGISQLQNSHDPQKEDSPTSSTISTSSSTLATNTQPPITVDPSTDVPRESTRRVFGGHVFITQDALTPMTSAFPTTPFEESPVSPRYFWNPSEHHKTPELPTTRPTTSSPQTVLKKNLSTKFADRSLNSTPQRNDNSEEFSDLVEALRKANAVESTRDTCLARPSSPKSRNASRSGRGERSNSVVAQRPPSAFGNRAQAQFSEQDVMMARPESSKSRNASRNRSRAGAYGTPVYSLDQNRARSASRNHDRKPTPLDLSTRSMSRSQQSHTRQGSSIAKPEEERHHSTSPNMEKIGADLMVFEEGERRPRRDSLECHADEDDFVVFHASMRRERHGVSREMDSERPDSQRANTPKHLGSPGLSFVKSPKESWSPNKPQASPGSPNSRGVSRGRQRTAKWTEAQASSKITSYKSSALSSPPSSWERTQADSLSRYKSPGIMKESAKVPSTSASRNRRDNSTHHSTNGSGAEVSTSQRKSSREVSEGPMRNSPDKYATSIRTVETESIPATPGTVPLTPKAMVLEPGWDKAFDASANVIESNPLRGFVSGMDRPNSVVW